jgi:hypothetical protein
MLKKIFLLALLSTLSLAATAQQEMSVFTATGRAGVSVTMSRDYQSIGINPANLGIIKGKKYDIERKRVVSLGFAEVAASASSDALQRPDLRKNFFSFSAFDTVPLTNQEKIDGALAFADAGVALNADVMALGVAVQPSRSVGGFAFSIRDRFSSSFRFNGTGAEIMFLGYNASYFDSLAISGGDTTGFSTLPRTFSQLFDGSRISLNWYREFNLSYGRVLMDGDKLKLYAGAGAKYLVGQGYMDVNITSEGLSAISALGPQFGIDYGSLTSPSLVTGGGNFTAVGGGIAFDVGVTAAIGAEEKLRVGLSITDIGSMTWNGNVFTANDTLFNGLGTHGVDSYNLIQEAEDITGDGGFFQWQGAEDVKVKLPTAIRVGASYEVNQKLQVGTDLILPANDAVGNFENAFVALGVDFRPTQWLRLSSGVSSSQVSGVNVPIGVYLSSPNEAFELGIASRDAITFFARNTPTLSVAMGLLRFKF